MKAFLVSQPASDGVFRHVEGLVGYLISQGVRVHLAYSDLGACDQLASLVRRVEDAGGRTFNMHVGNAPCPGDARALLGLAQLIHQIQPDIVHAHSSKAGALVRGLGLLGMRRRIFYTPHAYYRMNDPRGSKARVFHGIERLLRNRGTTLTCSTDEAAFARDHIGVSRQRTIANGVDIDRFRPATPGEVWALRADFGIPADALVLGTVGRFSAQKDPLTTYSALARIAEEIPNLFFVHLGKGELEPEVDALLAGSGLAARCRRIPYLADTAPFYHMLDGFLLASLYEGMSYAIIEAIASGLPLILSRAPGNQDFATYDLNEVYWTPPKDPVALAQAIRDWARHSASSTGERPNHRRVAEQVFSFGASYSRILAAYREEE